MDDQQKQIEEQAAIIAEKNRMIRILKADIAAAEKQINSLHRQIDELKMSRTTNVFYTA